MQKLLLILLIGSLLIGSGCGNKIEESTQNSQIEAQKEVVQKEDINAQNPQVNNQEEMVQEEHTIEQNIVKTKITVASIVEPSNKSKKYSEPKKDRSADIKAPDFKLAKLNGEEFKLSDFNGKVVMVNFWGTWCPPCRKEIPDLVKLQSKYNKDGLEIVGITLNSGSAADIQKFVDKRKMNYTVLTNIKDDETLVVTGLFSQAVGQAISGVPTTFIIDREGYIVKGYIGPRSEKTFYNDLKEYL